MYSAMRVAEEVRMQSHLKELPPSAVAAAAITKQQNTPLMNLLCASKGSRGLTVLRSM